MSNLWYELTDPCSLGDSWFPCISVEQGEGEMLRYHFPSDCPAERTRVLEASRGHVYEGTELMLQVSKQS